MSFTIDLVRDAHVKVAKAVNNGKTNAVVTVNGHYQHRFPSSSRVSKHLDLMTADDLSNRLSGGHYFFINEQLVDFRDGGYGNGFVHDDATIDAFVDHLGVEQTTVASTGETKYALRRAWDDRVIKVPGATEGGEFNSTLSFEWNPFVRTIDSSFWLMRLVCSNGMMGMSSVLNAKVPIVNRWEEHLEIASRQIQNRIDGVVKSRVDEMMKQRASVAMCSLLESHANARLKSDTFRDYDERRRLIELREVTAPRNHLSHVYTEALFEDKNLSSQAPAHLTMFDAFNIATEMRSHTNECKDSSSFALDRFANTTMFDNDSNYSVAALTGSRLPAFADANRAFFGQAS